MYVSNIGHRMNSLERLNGTKTMSSLRALTLTFP